MKKLLFGKLKIRDIGNFKIGNVEELESISELLRRKVR